MLGTLKSFIGNLKNDKMLEISLKTLIDSTNSSEKFALHLIQKISLCFSNFVYWFKYLNSSIKNDNVVEKFKLNKCFLREIITLKRNLIFLQNGKENCDESENYVEIIFNLIELYLSNFKLNQSIK